MQEDEGFLVDHNEVRIQQFTLKQKKQGQQGSKSKSITTNISSDVRELAETKHLHPETSGPRSIVRFRVKAQVVGHSVVVQVVEQLRSRSKEAN